MNEKKIEELAIAMAERHGITPEEPTSAISNTMHAFKKIAEALVEVARVFASVVSQIRGEIKEYVEQLEEGRYNRNRQAWPTVWDTRKQSQVISNKPKFMVQKIIG